MASLSYFCHRLSQRWINFGEESIDFQAFYRRFSLRNMDFMVDRDIPLTFFLFLIVKGHSNFKV